MEKSFDIFKSYADNPCLCEPSNKVTYKELGKIVEELIDACSTFRSAVLVFEQNIYCVAFYLACLISKKLVILLDPHSTQSDVIHIADVFNVSLIAGHSEIESSCFSHIYSKCEFNIYHTGYKITACPHPELAILVNTSGSTSAPKFVKLSYDNLICNTKQITRYLPINSDSFAGPPPPFSYVYGLSVLNTHLAMGGQIALCNDSVISKEYWNFVLSLDVTNINGVPYYYEVINKLNFYANLKKKLKFLTQAGGRMSDLVRERLISEFINSQIFIMYGQSEATARISYLPYNKIREKCGSVGIAVDGGKLSVDQNEIIYEGNNIYRGYAYSANDLTKLEDIGKLHTGDLGYLDDEGYLYITGRKSRFIKLPGKRLSLDDCERQLTNYGYECAIVQIDDKMKIYVVGNCSKKEVSQILGLSSIYFDLFYVQELTRTINGKIHYAKLF